MKLELSLRNVNDLKRLVFVLAVIFQSWSIVDETFGQTNPFAYRVGFQQNLNSYSWLTQIHYDRAIFGKGSFELQENFNSSLIRLSGNDHKWKDDQQLHVKLFVPASSNWGARFSASANSFTDRLSGLVNDIKTNWAMVGLLLQPNSKLSLSSDIGYKYDDRRARMDHGLTYNIQMKMDSLVINDYYNKLYFFNKSDQYSIRNNKDLEFQYNVKKYFQYGTIDSLSIHWSRMRRDNYNMIEIDNLTIETLSEENKGFQNSLIYGLKSNVFLGVTTKINQRVSSVEKNQQRTLLEARSKKDFQSENEFSMSMDQKFMLFNIALKHETNSQKNDVPDSLKTKRFSKYFYYISPDFQSSRLTLATMGKFYLFTSDTLLLNGSISRFRYDTPENNMDDRDEFRLNVNVSEIHHFNENLKLVVNGSVNLYHLVYIFSERSANNNWMRIFRLYPQVFFKPNHKIAVAQYFEVLANYVDYDYETGQTTTDLKSYVFRRFSFTQQIQAQITQRTDILLNYKLELEENGKLDWERWTQYLLMNRENHWLHFNFNYRIKSDLIISPGFILHNRFEKRNNLLSAPGGYSGQSGNIKSFGPTFKLVYQPHHRLHFSLDATRRAVITVSDKSQFINHVDLNLTWYN